MTDAQADLSLRGAHMSFCHAAAQSHSLLRMQDFKGFSAPLHLRWEV